MLHLVTLLSTLDFFLLERGLVVQPSESWDGLLEFLFEITGMSDANFAAHVEDQKCVSGWSVFLNSALVQEKS